MEGGDENDDFEEILQKVGNFGFYQKFRYLFVLLMFSTYLGGPPTTNLIVALDFPTVFQCNIPDRSKLPPLLKNLSTSKIGTWAFNQNKTDPCKNMRNLSSIETLMKTYGLNWKEHLANATYYDSCPSGHNYSLNEKTTLVTHYDLVCDRDDWPNIILTVTGAISIAGTFVFFQLPDRIGRKWTYILLVITQTLSSILCIFMPEVYSFMAASSLNNCTTPAMYILGIVWSLEFVGPPQRALVNAIYSMWFCVPLALIPLYAWLLPTWQSLYIVGLVPGAIFLPILWFYLDESPRWLRARGRYKETLQILMKIAKSNGKEVDEGQLRKAVESTAEENKGSTTEEDVEKAKSPGFLTLFTHKNLAIHSLAYWYILSVTGLILAGTSLASGSIGGNPYFVLGVISIAQLPGGALFYLVNYFGRIWPGAILTILSGFASLGATLVIGNDAWVITFVVLAGMFSSPALQVASITAQEIFPTVIRATAMAYGNTVMGIIVTPSPFIIASGKVVAYLPTLIFAVLGITAGVLFMFLPELWGQPLLETIEDSINGPVFGLKSFWRNVRFVAVREQWKRVKEEKLKHKQSNGSIEMAKTDNNAIN